MLSRAHRLTRGADYKVVVRRGQRCATPRMVAYAVRRADEPVRFGFIVSKQVGTAVVRNRVRRRLKAVCLGLIDSVAPGAQVVIRALPESADAPFDALLVDVRGCLRRVAA